MNQVALGGYVLLVLPALWIRRHQINPDAVCYLRLSTYLLHHDWAHGFSGYWSPLLPILTALLRWTGVPERAALHLVLAAAGGVYVWIASRWIDEFGGLPTFTRIALKAAVALVSVRLAVKILTPDLLMAACLLGYLRGVTAQSPSMRRTFAAGLMAGLAYLAKAYALPFFLVHFPITILLARYWQPPAGGWRRGIARLTAGLAGFAILAVPWTALLDHYSHRFTIGTAGTFNHNNVEHAPPEVQYRWAFFVPPPPYIIENEIKDRPPLPAWSALDSADHLHRQMAIVRDNTRRIVVALASFDGLWLTPAALIAAAGLLLLRRGDARLAWLSLTILIYCAGYACVYFEPRLIEAPLRIVAMLLCVWVAWALAQVDRQGRIGRLLPCAVAGVILVCAGIEVAGAFRSARRDAIFQQAADAMRQQGLTGPIASNNRGAGMYVAYFLNQPLVTIPPEDNAAMFERDCRRGGVRCIVVAESKGGKISGSVAEQVVKGEGWVRRLSISQDDAVLQVYERR